MIYQGIACTWIGECDPEQTLACPFCGGGLRALPDFWAEVIKVELGTYSWPAYKLTPQPADWKPRPHPGYRAMWEWARQQQDRCFKHIMHLRNSYQKHAGINVEIEP